jgi:hypothetical protein
METPSCRFRRLGEQDEVTNAEARKGLGLLTRAAALALLLPFGCAPTGDFGRRGPTLLHDTVLPRVGAYAARLRGEAVSSLPLTDDEIEMRHLAYAIVAPAPFASYLDRASAEARLARLAPIAPMQAGPRHYYEALRDAPFRSSEARFGAVASHVQADNDRLTPFFSVAKRVTLADDGRLAALRYAPLDRVERLDVEARIIENRELAAWVRATLKDRAKAYRYAIDRLAVDTPSTSVHAARVTLSSFEGRLGNPLGEPAFPRRPSMLR